MTVKSLASLIISIGKAFALAILISFVTFALLELISTFFLPKPPVDRAPLPRAVSHPTLGYVLVPNQVTYTYGQIVKTNSDGLREREFDRKILSDIQVILCLGGSETFGKGVAFEKTFPKVLEQTFERRRTAKRPTLVINAGVPDYNLKQSLQFLRERGEDLNPEVVVLSFYWDDLIDLVPAAGIGGKTSQHTKSKGPKKNPVHHEWFLRRWARAHGLVEVIAPIYTRSRLLCSVKNKLKIRIGRWRGHTYIVWRDAILEGRSVPALERAWSYAETLLRDFVELSKQQEFRPVLLVFPIEHQLESSYSNARYQNLILENSRSLSLETVDLLPSFQRHYTGFTSLFIPYDCRPNEMAHAIAAGQIFQALQDPKQEMSNHGL
jgi:hypothetical protein